MSFNVEVEGGSSVRLPTKGKYCDRDIVVTATGGGGELTLDGIASGTQPQGNIVLNCESVRDYAFYKYSGIWSVRSDTVKTVGERSFSNMSAGSINMPNVTKCGNYAFAVMTYVGALSFPQLTSAGNSTFQDNRTPSVDLPLLATCPTSLFQGCQKMTSVNVPKLTSINSNAFSYCKELTTIDLPEVKSIGQNGFGYSSKLNSIILRYASGVTLSNVNAFQGTPFAKGGSGGEIYVPQALIDSGFYTTATNWSVINGYGTVTWKAIEGSEYE
jgi:hypothetical protein